MRDRQSFGKGYLRSLKSQNKYRDDYYELFASNVFGMMGFYTPFVYLPNMAQQYVSIFFFICNLKIKELKKNILCHQLANHVTPAHTYPSFLPYLFS